MVIGGNRSLQDADTYWQIVVGQSIIDHRALPHTDIYSFTRLGAPWMSSSWLAQVLYAASYAVAGWAGPVILAALGTAAAFALLVHILCRYFSAVHAIIVTMAAVLMSAHSFRRAPASAGAAGDGGVGLRSGERQRRAQGARHSGCCRSL